MQKEVAQTNKCGLWGNGDNQKSTLEKTCGSAAVTLLMLVSPHDKTKHGQNCLDLDCAQAFQYRRQMLVHWSSNGICLLSHWISLHKACCWVHTGLLYFREDWVMHCHYFGECGLFVGGRSAVLLKSLGTVITGKFQFSRRLSAKLRFKRAWIWPRYFYKQKWHRRFCNFAVSFHLGRKWWSDHDRGHPLIIPLKTCDGFFMLSR